MTDKDLERRPTRLKGGRKEGRGTGDPPRHFTRLLVYHLETDSDTPVLSGPRDLNQLEP